jgi:hypothetical protein
VPTPARTVPAPFDPELPFEELEPPLRDCDRALALDPFWLLRARDFLALPFEARAPFLLFEPLDDVRDEPAEEDLRLPWDDVFPLLEEPVLA